MNQAWTYREQYKAVRADFFKGTKTETELNEAADLYIAEIRAFKQRTGDKRLKIPTRGQLLRTPLC
jgi:hypothetical protein